MKTARDRVVLVTGASGRLGRRVSELLLESGLHHGQIIAGTRTPERIEDLRLRGAEVRRLDFDDPQQLPAALAGAHRILFIGTREFRPVGRRVGQMRAAVDAARRLPGVERLYYTSVVQSLSESAEEAPIALTVDHAGCERQLRDSGLPHTLLRHGFYADGLLRRVPGMLSIGAVYGFEGNSGMTWIPREDCARNAVAMLLHEQPPDGPVDVTGAEVLSSRALASTLTAASGIPVRFVACTPKSLFEAYTAVGIPRATAAVGVAMEAAYASGVYDVLSDVVKRYTGRGPTPMREFLAANLPHDSRP